MKRILLLMLLITNVLLCHSQELKNHAPVAPNSASLGAYGAVPISYYTGTTQVSVPVYAIKTNNLNFPIALSYRGDGFKVVNEATFVGLDWTLSNTGVITRTVEGLDDLSSVGFPHHTTAQLSVGNGMDPAPDVFYYNVNGHSGSFVMDYPGTIRLLRKDEDITIWFDPDQNFTIITAEGTTYRFAKKEYQDQTLTISSSSGTHTVNHHYLTSWYLSTVTSNTGEVMTFNYTEGTRRTVSDHQVSTSSTFNWLNIVPGSACTNDNYFNILHEYQNGYNSSNTTTTHAVTDEVLVDNITFSGGKVQFYYSDRLDIQPEVVYQYAKKLDEVKVYDDNNIVVKDCSFTYDYVYSSTTGMVGYIDTRMRLRSFYETPWGTDPKLTYAFSYNETSSVPFPAKSDAYNTAFGYYAADPTIWLLTQIKYPTGGSTNFTYESQGGGLYGVRVGKIENRDANDVVVGCKKLLYSGDKAIVPTTYSYTATMTFPYSCTNSGSEFPSFNTIYVNYTVTDYHNFLQTGPSSAGNLYGYDQVTELDGPNGENGKTVYNYYNVADNTNDLAVPTTHDQNDGLLLSQETYKNTGSNTFSLLKKTVYTPLTRNQVIVDGANFSTMGNAFSHYNIYTQEVVTTKEETWTYNPSGTMYDATDYTYTPNYLQPATIQNTLSDGKVLTTINRYAYDMPQVSPYSDMMAFHMISQPIEIEKQLNGVKINKTVNQYSNTWSSFPTFVLPSNIQTQKSSDPVETRIQYNDYDGYGNSNSLSYTRGPNVAYIWGYNGLYPIVKAINAVPGNIAFSNCEDPLTTAQTDKSGSNIVFYSNLGTYTSWDAHTGQKSFNLTNGSSHTISTRNTLPAGKYVFSYWSKGSTPTSDATVVIPSVFTVISQKNQPADSKGWQYHENVVNIPSANYFTISPNAAGADVLIDDIRIYPIGAEMTTYTYNPLVGVTSMTDARNNTTYYEYDYFHRLTVIKDQDGNIKNRYCYNYAGQSFGCLIPFTPPPVTPTPDPPVGLYFRVEISNVNNEYYGSGDEYSSFQTGDVCIKLYSNPECTIPLTLSYDIPFVLTMGDNILDDLGGNIAEPDYGIFTLTAGNSSYCLGTMDLDDITHYIGSDSNPHYQEFVYHYDLTPGSNAYRTKPTVFN